MVWLSGSGGADEMPLPLSHLSANPGAYNQWRSRCPLEPMLGGFVIGKIGSHHALNDYEPR